MSIPLSYGSSVISASILVIISVPLIVFRGTGVCIAITVATSVEVTPNSGVTSTGYGVAVAEKCIRQDESMFPASIATSATFVIPSPLKSDISGSAN